MPRKCNVDKTLALDVLEQFYDHFKSFNRSDWPRYTSNVYKEMSKAVEGKWTAHNWYIAVKEDRRNILSEVRRKLGIEVDHISDVQYSDSETENVDPDGDPDSESDHSFEGKASRRKLDEMNLILSKEEWSEIKPVPVEGQRTGNRLKPNVWASKISTAFWKQHRLPCSYVFKRSEVCTSGNQKYFLKIKGNCVSKKCKNPFIGYVDNDPHDGELLIRVFTWNTSCEDHEQVTRPLRGGDRKNIGKSAASEGCSNLRKRMAREYMKAGDTIPPFIPPLHVLRCAKKEYIDEELGIKKTSRGARDIMKNIEDISLKPPFLGCILETGSMPLKVIYCTPMQFDLYKKYIRTTKDSSEISIDATGSLVEKIKRDGIPSAHIFLYSIVVNFEKTSLSVFQMLSESQTMEAIQHWLHIWKRHKVPYPKTIICDYSRALLTACARTFNDSTLKAYVENCFQQATSELNTEHLEPTSYLRVDVSHLIKMVCRWRCFQSVQQRAVRNFFVRCVGLMVDCQSTEQFESIFSLTCIMALQPFRDSTLKIRDQIITVEHARKQLETLIKTRPFLHKNDEGFLNANPIKIEGNIESDKDANKVYDDEDTDTPANSGKIGMFIARIAAEAGQDPVHSGEDLNAFYVPDLINNHLLKLAKEFPLWTAATLPFYASHATSAPVEQTFDDLKNRVLAQFPRVINCEKFIKIHLKDLLGGANLLSSNLLNFAMKRENLPIPQPKKEVDTSNEEHNSNRYEIPTEQNDSKISDHISIEHNYSYISTGQNQINNHDISTELDFNKPIFNYEKTTEKKNAFIQSPLKRKLDDSDNFSVENWRGKAGKPTIICCSSPKENNSSRSTLHLEENAPQIFKFQAISQSSSTFFQRYPEIDLVNEKIAQKIDNPNKQIIRKCESFNFLKNGSLSGPVTLNGETVFCRDTCGFDSISQILRAATIDDPNCAKIISDSSISCSMAKFIETFASATCTKQDMYRERAAILSPAYCSTKQYLKTEKRSLSHSFSAVDSVFSLWKKLFPSMISLTRKTSCNFCNLVKEHHQHSIIPHEKLIKPQKIGTLTEAINFHEHVDVKCPQCHRICHVTMKPGTLIFVELDVRRSVYQQIGESFKLTEFPTTLQLDVPYKLAGVIGHRPGHFIGYAKRLNGWQIFDDIRDKAERASENLTIVPHGAIFYRTA